MEVWFAENSEKLVLESATLTGLALSRKQSKIQWMMFVECFKYFMGKAANHTFEEMEHDMFLYYLTNSTCGAGSVG